VQGHAWTCVITGGVWAGLLQSYGVGMLGKDGARRPVATVHLLSRLEIPRLLRDFGGGNY
jgi:hypothetical protein